MRDLHYFFLVFKILCVIFTYNTYQFGLVTFQLLDSHKHLVATILDYASSVKTASYDS